MLEKFVIPALKKTGNSEDAGLAVALEARIIRSGDFPFPPIVNPDIQQEVSRETLVKIRSIMLRIAHGFQLKDIKFLCPATAEEIHERIGPLLSDGIKLKDLRVPDRKEIEALKLDPSYNPVVIKTIRRHSAPYNRLLNRLIRNIEHDYRQAQDPRGENSPFDPTIGELKTSKMWSAIKADYLSPWNLEFVRIAFGPVPSEKV